MSRRKCRQTTENSSPDGSQAVPRRGAVEQICRKNGVTARLTKHRSPTTTGKIERWHQSLRRELLDECGPFEDVDVVVNTHLHVDHVGWNTVDADGEWIPTFPNAQYLLPAADDFHFGPGNAGRQAVDRLIHEDSFAPVHRAGQAVLWDGRHRIDEHLTLESAPGHTPRLLRAPARLRE